MDFAENFEDLKILERTRALADEVYDAKEKCRYAVSNCKFKA